MARGALSFRQTDVTRAVRAVLAAGQQPTRVEVDRAGKIIVILKGDDNAVGSCETHASQPGKIIL
jgi:hypothetical protein